MYTFSLDCNLASDACLGTDVEVVAPTWLEFIAARVAVRGHAVRHSGIAKTTGVRAATSPVVVCGLAGALGPELPPGSVIVAETVGTESGAVYDCDPQLVRALVDGGRRLAIEVRPVRLLSAGRIVTGSARERWRQAGYEAVDMEVARWLSGNSRTTSLRVILDTPDRSLSEDWLHPSRALLRPRLWPELLWLAAHAPRYAIRAARVVDAGLQEIRGLPVMAPDVP